MSDADFFRQVNQELAKARAIFPDQEFEYELEGWLSILVEEVGEVARDLNDSRHLEDSDERRANLLNELVQVAAMACRMHQAVQEQWVVG